jgi:hypothetical protein
MLNSFKRIFDYFDYEKKLRHYFSDSAPIRADITIGLREVHVLCSGKIPVSCEIEESVDVSKNVRKIIDACVDGIYPRMTFSKQVSAPFSDDRKKHLLIQGLSIEQIHEKEWIKRTVCFILTRFNEHDSTIDYIEEATRDRFRAHLYKPLMLVKDKIWELDFKGRDGTDELYQYLMSMSKQEVLKVPDVEEGECAIQES